MASGAAARLLAGGAALRHPRSPRRAARAGGLTPGRQASTPPLTLALALTRTRTLTLTLTLTLALTLTLTLALALTLTLEALGWHAALRDFI